MILLQIDPGVINSMNNIYQLIGLAIISVVYIITIFYNRKQNKSQTEELIKTFEEQNDKIITKMEQLKDNKNTLDVQASMDIINALVTKSMLEIVSSVKYMIEENSMLEQKSLYMSKKSIVFEKIKNLIDTHIGNDIIVLSRIFNNNIKLSYYLSELDRNELIDEITHKIFSLTDKTNCDEVVDYIENRFSQIIQSIQMKLTK